jgi:hypothetical protein
MVTFQSGQEFLQANSEALFYVGFLKSPNVWFPLAILSSPEKKRLDSLCLSRSCRAMGDVLKSYAGKLTAIEQTFVQFLRTEEIANLMERYGFEQVAVIFGENDDEPVAGCECGGACGCC